MCVLCVQHEYGAGSLARNEQKAIMYYNRVMELAPPGGGHIVPVQLALMRCVRGVSDCPFCLSIHVLACGDGALFVVQ